jgi:uncharacterized membrane protein YczE
MSDENPLAPYILLARTLAIISIGVNLVVVVKGLGTSPILVLPAILMIGGATTWLIVAREWR